MIYITGDTHGDVDIHHINKKIDNKHTCVYREIIKIGSTL